MMEKVGHFMEKCGDGISSLRQSLRNETVRINQLDTKLNYVKEK